MCMLTLIFLFAFFKCNRYESKSLRRKRSYAYIKNILIRLFLVKVRVRVTGIIKTWFLEAFLITQDAILIISRKNHYSNPKNCWAETLNVWMNIRSGEIFFWNKQQNKSMTKYGEESEVKCVLALPSLQHTVRYDTLWRTLLNLYE